MNKKNKLLIIVFAVIMVIGLMACTQNYYYTLQLTDPDAYYSFAKGNVDLSKIAFDVLDGEGEIVETKTVEESMLSPEDIAKLANNTGTFNITVKYNGATIIIQITISEPQVKINYTVTFDAGEGYFPAAGQGGATTTIKTVSTANIPDNELRSSDIPIPRRVGYELSGWYPNASGEGTRLAAPYKVNGDQTFYARWRRAENKTVTFINSQAGGQPQQIEVEYAAAVTTPSAPVISGYTFKGWLYDGAYYAQGAQIENITDDIAVYATYEIITYKLTFTCPSLLPDAKIEKSVEYNTNYVLDFEPWQIDGYKFSRWVLKGTTNVAVDGNDTIRNVTSNIEIVAEYTEVYHKIRFYTDYNVATGEYENLIIDYDVRWNTRLNNPPQPTAKDGHYADWYYLNSGTPEPAATLLQSNITRDLNIYIKYTKMSFLFTYVHGQTQVERYYEYDTLVAVPDLSTTYNPRYYTVKWYYNPNFIDPVIGTSVAITKTTTIYAEVVANPFDVEFYFPTEDTDGNPITGIETGLVSTQKIARGGNATPPTSPINDKYMILGWVDENGDAASYTSIQDFRTAADGTALYAVIAVRVYGVTFFNMTLNQGEAEYTTEVERYDGIKYGTVIANGADVCPPATAGLAAPAPNYVFIGWRISMSTPVVNFAAGYELKGNVSFYAEWIDTEKGTEGLKFAPVYEADGFTLKGYKVSAFVPKEHTTYFDEIYIPSMYEGYPVIGIGAGAFVDLYTEESLPPKPVTVKAIRLTENIQFVEEGAFMGCVALERFTIAGGLTETLYLLIDNDVLYSLDGTLIAYPAARVIDGYVVLDDVNGTPVTRIADGAFAASSTLKTLVLSDSLVEIGKSAFENSTLTEIIIPASVERIGEKAFVGCFSLADITIAGAGYGALKYVGKEAFNDTAWFRDWQKDGESLPYLALGGVLISAKVEYQRIDIEDFITAIADEAFADKDITEIYAGENSNLAYIGKGAFKNNSIRNITFLSETIEIEIELDAFFGIINGEMRLTVANDAMVIYYSNGPLGAFEINANQP